LHGTYIRLHETNNKGQQASTVSTAHQYRLDDASILAFNDLCDLPELSRALAGLKRETATLADPYRNYSLDYASQDNSKSQEQSGLLVYQTTQPQVVHHGATAEMPFVPRGAQQPAPGQQHHHHHHHHQQQQQQHSQHASPSMLRASVTHSVVPDVHPQPLLMNPHQLAPPPLSSQYPPNPLQFQPSRAPKRARVDGGEGSEDENRLDLGFQMLKTDSHPEGTQSPDMMMSAHSDSSTPHRTYALPPPIHPQQQQHHHHHHHRLPQALIHPSQQAGGDMNSPPMSSGLPSVVGQAGMPDPAPRPRGPKLKFTPEEDSLLVELKENKNLTWKQISDFFPGRTSGTLQVRYCTKLKAKDTVWTDEMVRRSVLTGGSPPLKSLSLNSFDY
jgi:hypothetical protein